MYNRTALVSKERRCCLRGVAVGSRRKLAAGRVGRGRRGSAATFIRRLERHGFVGSSSRKTLYFSTIAGTFCAMQNVLPKLKLSLSQRLRNGREQKRESRRTLMLNAKAVLLVANKMLECGMI